MSNLDRIPAVLNKRVFQKVFKIAEVSNLTKEEKAMYDSNLKAKWDYENSIAYAKEIAAEEGMKMGLEKGIEKGIEKGRHDEALDIARELKKEGSSIEFIAKITKLSVDEIEKL
jgi:predicted transposase/invertase (TIGR01784 family)